MAEIKPISDRELWVVKNTELGWSIPVYCDPYTSDGLTLTHYAVRPAIALLAGPHHELELRLRKYDLSGSKNHWVIEAQHLPLLAEKAPGITPAFYLRWNGVANKAMLTGIEELPESKVSAWEFLEYIATKSALDFGTLKIVWAEIQRHAPDWLLNKQLPLYFGFCTIYALPMRVNWKEVILGKHIKIAPVFSKPEAERNAILQECGFIEDLGSSDMLAMSKNFRYFKWSLECLPTDYWHQCVRETESVRLGVKGPVRYARHYEERLRKALPQILHSFATWIKQMAQPVARLGKSHMHGYAVLLPCRREHWMLARRRNPATKSLVLQDVEVALKPGTSNFLPKTAESLLSLPDIPSEHEDVRQPASEEQVVESSDK